MDNTVVNNDRTGLVPQPCGEETMSFVKHKVIKLVKFNKIFFLRSSHDKNLGNKIKRRKKWDKYQNLALSTLRECKRILSDTLRLKILENMSNSQ